MKSKYNSFYNKVSPNQISFLDAPCGSGKTYSVIQKISKEQDWTRSIIAVPSIDLANQISRDLKKQGVEPFNINSRTHPNKSVQGEIQKAIKECNEREFGCIIITHNAFFNLDQNVIANSKDEWDLYFDEAPQIDHFYKPAIPRSFSIIAEMIEPSHEINGKYWAIKIKNQQKLQDFVDSYEYAMDTAEKEIYPLLRQILDGYHVSVNKEQWDKVEAKKIEEDAYDKNHERQSKNAIAFCTRLPSDRFLGYRSSTIMAANFRYSMCYRAFERNDLVEWVENEELRQNLRYSKHENGKYLEIIPLSEKRASKTRFYSKDKDTGELNIQEYINRASAEIGERKTLFQINNGIQWIHSSEADETGTNEIVIPDNWKNIPVIVHGLNRFQSYSDIVLLSAFNRCPELIATLEAVDCIDPKELARITSHEIAQQTVNRTSIRNPESTQKVRAYMPDEASAETLASMFIGCSIRKPFSSRKHIVYGLSNNERQGKRRKDILARQTAVNNSRCPEKISTESIFVPKCNSRSIVYSLLQNGTEVDSNNMFTDSVNAPVFLYQDLWSNTPYRCIGLDDATAAGVFFKKHFSNNIFREKHSNTLFSMTYFEDPMDPENYAPRLKTNAIATAAVILDIDAGDMTPDDMERFLKREKWASLMYSSAGHKADERQLNKFRVIIFPDQLISADAYPIVIDHILNKIKDFGFHSPRSADSKKWLEEHVQNVKFSGIDASKLNLFSVFYMPGKLRGNEHNAFFKTFYLKRQEIYERGRLLKIGQIIQNSIEKNNRPDLLTKEVDADYEETHVESPNDDTKQKKLITFIEKKIEELTPGSRSFAAQKIAPFVRRVEDWHEKERLRQLVCSSGIDRSAQRSFLRYSR